jgi:outer membrane protein insertion porin family
MSSKVYFPFSRFPLAIVLSSSFSIVFWSIPSFAQESTTHQTLDSVVAPVESLNLSRLDSLRFPTAVSTSTHATDLLPDLASSTLRFDGKLPLAIIADNAQGNDAPAESKDPKKQKRFSFYIGSHLPDPTTLKGSTREPIVPASKNIDGGISLSGGTQVNLSKSTKLFLEVKGGESVLGADLSLFYGSDDLRSGVAFNVFNQRSFSPSFVGGTDVNLLNGNTPWVSRLGGGVEVRHPWSKYLDSSVGITYQSVRVLDSIFGSKSQPIDQFGNQLTVSSKGRDDLLTLNLALQYDTRDDAKDPSRGTHLRVGLDQSIPSGNGAIGMTRLSASASQFFPLPFFSKQKSILVLNVQGGSIFGDVPPYEAFNLGGGDTVRGFKTSAIGTGSSFIQASAEYRFPLFDLNLFKQPIDVGGALFIDYGSLLGTQNDVIGQPGIARNKTGEGLGYGAGLSLKTRFGVVRVDAGFSEQGEVQGHVSLNERF